MFCVVCVEKESADKDDDDDVNESYDLQEQRKEELNRRKKTLQRCCFSSHLKKKNSNQQTRGRETKRQRSYIGMRMLGEGRREEKKKKQRSIRVQLSLLLERRSNTMNVCTRTDTGSVGIRK